MSENAPEGPSLARLLLALNVRRNTAIGLAVGIGVAIVAYVYRVIVVDPAPGAATSPVLFGALAVTLALSCGAFIAVVLTVGAAIRRARRVGREGNP